MTISITICSSNDLEAILENFSSFSNNALKKPRNVYSYSLKIEDDIARFYENIIIGGEIKTSSRIYQQLTKRHLVCKAQLNKETGTIQLPQDTLGQELLSRVLIIYLQDKGIPHEVDGKLKKVRL